MKRSKAKPIEGFAAVYNYKHSFGKQIVYIKYEDDAKAIDLLISNNMERQAISLANLPGNKIKEVS